VLSVPASLPLILPGFFEPHDLHHFGDIYQMARAIASGQLPPRWGPDFLFNYGYPLFNFYYVMPFYLGALLFFVLGSISASFKLVFLTSIILSVFGMYLFLREFVGKWAAIAGSILFLYTPYRAVEIYVRGAMGEVLALSLMPLVFWGIARIIKGPKNIKVAAGVSMIVAIFILSHNYLWAMSLPFLALLILVLIAKKKQKGLILVRLLIAGFLSLGLTAYWMLPALFEKEYIASTTPFPLANHFPFVKQLIIPSWGYGSSVWGPGDEISLQIGVVNLAVLAVIGILLLFRRKLFINKLFFVTLWAVAGFAVSVVLMNIRTLPLWELVPFHDFVQFPWRLLIFTTFFTAVLAAVLVEIADKRRRKLIGMLIIGISVLLTFNYFKPSQIVYKNDNDYLSRLFANRALEGKKDNVSQEYLQWSEDYLLLPNWTDVKPSSLPNSKIEIAEGKGEIQEIKEIDPITWKASVDAKTSLKVNYNSLYFPGWYAKVDGSSAEIKPGKPYGQIELEVPMGKHEVEFFWSETPLRRSVNIISFASLLLVAGILVSSRLATMKSRLCKWE
jgi:hypothetical protein